MALLESFVLQQFMITEIRINLKILNNVKWIS